ncbi:hypothetical protein A9P82_05570 [Arachidicoccus ginsenosidimutans]|uniref:DUF4302 domain-containing protein n=1 Tax=Arachidicoccus sp. BS20 TaxID=1850526 RepID=UPI0007F0E1F6|nr:DUF4302 domain-containing protein [Arachidicoccus sp. BS20]ANI88802.1 hypothetical protein A9P82_05570 [Arachidicoccus sp. BS20]
MKKISSFLFSLFAIVFFISSCKKDSYVAKFDKSPEARMSDTINFVKKTLTSAPDGWIVTTPVYFGGGYGFYMSFDDSLQVTMYSDLLDQFASTSKQSQTRLRADMGAALTFDTYNYITELNDPDNNVRNGYGGDVDYIYDHTNGDSIVFLGKRYRMPLSFVKATAAQKAIYTSGGYLTAIQAFRDFFTANSNAYIALDDGTNIAIVPNASNDLDAGKRVTFTTVDGNGDLVSSTAKFAYTVDEMSLLDSGVNIAGLQFKKIAWKDAQTLAVYTSTGGKYPILQSPVPLIPAVNVFTGGGSVITVANETSASGWGSDFVTRRASTNAGINGWNVGGSQLSLGEISFMSINGAAKTFTLRVVTPYGSSSYLNLDYSYSYEVNSDNTLKFTYRTSSGNANALYSTLSPLLQERINTDNFALDYYIDPDTNVAYMRFTSVDNPTFVFTGTF